MDLGLKFFSMRDWWGTMSNAIKGQEILNKNYLPPFPPAPLGIHYTFKLIHLRKFTSCVEV